MVEGGGSSFQAEEVKTIQSKSLKVLVYVRDKGERGGEIVIIYWRYVWGQVLSWFDDPYVPCISLKLTDFPHQQRLTATVFFFY